MKHMTQAELARAAGISQSAIASYECRHRRSSRATFRLAAILKVDPGWLHTGEGSMIPSQPEDAVETPEHVLAEPEMHPWPLHSVTPAQFNALQPAHKRVLEATIAGYVQACLEEYAMAAVNRRSQK